MKKIFYTLTLIGYLFTVSSLTHVFAMTNEFVNNNVQDPNYHGCCHESKHVKETNKGSSEDFLDCCELIYSSEFEFINVDKSFLLDIQNIIICNFLYSIYYDSLENIGIEEEFLPPGWENNKSVTYHKLVGIIKNLN